VKMIAKLLARPTRDDRGAATLSVGLGAVLAGITLLAAITLFTGPR
jgi:hypothetical protein